MNRKGLSAIWSDSALSILVAGCRLVSGLVVLKVIAITAGPAGIAEFGQLTNFVTVLTAIASLGLANAVLRHGGEDSREAQSIMSATLISTGIAGAVVCLCIGGNMARFLELLRLEGAATKVLLLSGVAAALAALSSIQLNYLVARNMLRRSLTVQLISTVLLIPLTLALVSIWGPKGVLWVPPAGLLLLTGMTIAAMCGPTIRKFSIPTISVWKQAIRTLAPFAAFSVGATLASPILQMAIRSQVIEAAGVVVAGQWQAYMRLSDAACILVSSALGGIWLAKLSNHNRSAGRNAKLEAQAILIAPAIMITLGAFTYLGRFQLFPILFTNEFIVVDRVLAAHIFGDVCRSVGWMCAVVLLSRSRAILAVIPEVLQVLTPWLINPYLAEGTPPLDAAAHSYLLASMAYCLAGLVAVSRSAYASQVILPKLGQSL